MEDRTGDGTPTVDLGPSEPREAVEPAQIATPSAFDPPAQRFEAVGELGRGGMGRVDDAYDRALGRPVAIKHMLSTSDVALGRFEREARITARLEHPGIVPIHDAGRGPDGTPYYVMRRVDGQPLDAKLGTTLAERLALIPNVLAACDAVAFAHARGIVHRDIKPTNILVGPFGETLVIDWGLAREIGETDASPAAVAPSDPQLTIAGTVAGTPGFMAPEQARGEAVDARADVFALGATLFYVLSGALPYDTASATEMVSLAGAGRAPNWRVIPSEVPPDLRAIAVKAMASEAAERYPDAGALATDLRQFITGNLVVAYDYGALGRFVRFVRRHRAAVAVAAVSAVVVAVIAVLSVRRIVFERDDARTARGLAETRQHELASMRDRLIAENALQLAKTDPIAAISMLRTLPPDSEHWREARVAASQAFVRGIPFGFAGTSNFGYVQIHRDGRLAVVGAQSTGQLQIIDLIARTKRELMTPCTPLYVVVWLGPTHVVCGTKGAVAIVEITTGTSRRIELDLDTLLGNRDSIVWVTTKDHRLFQLDSPTGELRELAAGFDDLDTSPLLDEALFRRGNKFEAWVGADRIHFELPVPAPIMTGSAIRDHRIILLENWHIHAFKIDGTKVVPITGFTPRRYVQLNIVEERFYLESGEGMNIFKEGVDLGTDPTHGISFPVPTGLVRVNNDGEVDVVDRNGSFRIERRQSSIKRVDVSIDGRFVVALGESGETLIWDLASVRPKRYWIDNGESVAQVTKHYLWILDLFYGMRRISFATGASEEVLENPMSGAANVSEDETFASAALADHVQVRDFKTGHQIAFETSMIVVDGPGLMFMKPDLTLWRWRAGRDELTSLGTLKRKPWTLAGAEDFVVTMDDDGTTDRRRISTGAVEHATVSNTGQLGIIDNGTVLIRRNDGSVLRWELGGVPTVLDLGGPVDDVVTDHDRVSFYSRRALTLLIGDKRYIAPHGSSAFGWAGKTTALTTNVNGEPMITDLITGLGYEIPTRAYLGVQQPIGLGNTFVMVVDRRDKKYGLDVWTVDVPEDPAALRAWLSTITNATPIPGTTAYQWP